MYQPQCTKYCGRPCIGIILHYPYNSVKEILFLLPHFTDEEHESQRGLSNLVIAIAPESGGAKRIQVHFQKPIFLLGALSDC